MPRPTTKTELLSAADGQFAKMWTLALSMPPEMQTAAFDFGGDAPGKEAHWQRDQNLRDVFIHLYEWHVLLLDWIKANQNGESKPFLPEPYNWKSYGDMNLELWKKHQTTSHTDAIAMLRRSHAEVTELIAQFSDEELFGKKFFPWTGTTNLASYCISATSSHYDWAMKKLKHHIKTQK